LKNSVYDKHGQGKMLQYPYYSRILVVVAFVDVQKNKDTLIWSDKICISMEFIILKLNLG
jgi:hypothetical protein